MKRMAAGAVIVGVIAVLAIALWPRPMVLQMAQVTRRSVREFIAEEAKTRLPDTYTIDMPINGTLERIDLNEGDVVDRNQVVARVDPFDLEQQIASVEARIAQARAHIEGVDAAKPKPEDLQSAKVAAEQQQDALEIARNDSAIARTRFGNAQKDYERYTALRQTGAVSQSAFDNVQLQYEAAKRDLDRMEAAEAAAQKGLERARLEYDRVTASVDDNEYLRAVYHSTIEELEAQRAALAKDLAKCGIVSPVDGTILDKYVEDSRVLAAGTELLRIGPRGGLEIEADVLSEEVGQIEVGDPVEIHGKALGGRIVPGRVTRIYPAGFKKISALGIEQQRVKVIAEFDGGGEGLRPGTSVDVRIITGEAAGALAVPERAVFRHDGGWAVMAVHDGKARLAPVTIGLKNDEWAQIAGGLAEGDSVVTELKNELEDGMRVEAADS